MRENRPSPSSLKILNPHRTFLYGSGSKFLENLDLDDFDAFNTLKYETI